MQQIHKPQIDTVIRECMDRDVEISAYPDIDIANLRFRHLADAPLPERILELLGRNKQAFDGSRYIPWSLLLKCS